MQPELTETKRLETLGWIDPTLNLANHHVYIFASPDDTVVDPSHGAQLNLFYSSFLSATQIQRETGLHAAHGFPTLQSGGPCDLAASPYILNCNYDTAGEILKSLYGPLKPRGGADATHLIKFSQQEFTLGGAPLYTEGWLYVPAECADQTVPCRLHVALHGCKMNPDFIQDRFATLAGYNEWAESNRILILYPQVAAFEPTNPNGCWDWYGYTGSTYATQTGPEMAALKKMIDRLKGVH